MSFGLNYSVNITSVSPLYICHDLGALWNLIRTLVATYHVLKGKICHTILYSMSNTKVLLLFFIVDVTFRFMQIAPQLKYINENASLWLSALLYIQ